MSNTSPVVNLAAIGQLPLLSALYRSIIVPNAVYDEIVVKGSGQAGADEVQNCDWIYQRALKNPTLAQALLRELDDGEAAAIALAVELKADLLLMDERIGRAVAKRFGLNYVGLLGVLIEAKHKGTRVTLKTVLASLAEGARIEEILHDLPTLTEEDARAVIAFAAASAEEDLPLHSVPTIP